MNENENGVVNTVDGQQAGQVKSEPKPEQKTEPKKENWFKRTKKKIGQWAGKHPALTAFIGAGIGSAATVGVCEVGKRVMNNRQQQYVPQEDPNSIDPNL